jgi:DNA-binding response OmpR family regulator
MTRVLLVDDEPAIVDAVTYALRGAGFDVEGRADGESALDEVGRGTYDVLILDDMLPGLSGTEVCRRVRATDDIPIIMLTARDSEASRVFGLESGADDYVTKPFSMVELMSRVRSILRRRDLDRRASAVRLRWLSIDHLRHRVEVDGRPVSLTPSEFRLLALLAAQPDRVFSRLELTQHLWESPHVGPRRTCDVHIANLRRKLEREPKRPERLLTVRGVGYKLAAPEDPDETLTIA